MGDEDDNSYDQEWYCPIMSIPREIRRSIYAKLPQWDRVNLRLVCNQWRLEVDELCEFSAKIDDRKENWERVLHIRLEACEIIHFLKAPPNGPATGCLKFTNLLRTLKIMTNLISPENFFYLLSDCAASITQLCLQLEFPLLGKSFGTSIANFDFSRLKSLKVNVSTMPDPATFPANSFPLSANKESEILFSQILTNPIPQLQHLEIELSLCGAMLVSKMSGVILQFIASHYRSLRSVDIELIQGHGMPTSEFIPLHDSDLEKINFNSLAKVTKLKSLRIVSSSSVGANVWIDLIECQTRLEYFEADLLPVPSFVFQNLISNNFNSLVVCEITDLTVWDSEGEAVPFDVSVFQNCYQLKKLVLDRNVIARRRYDCSELINLYQLPESLYELALNFFNVLSEEFVMYFDSPSGSNLRTLTLNQCGTTGLFGINGTVMEKVINLLSIIFVEISPLNFTDPEECTKLNGILLTHGYSEGHSYFQLSKLQALIHFGNLLRLDNNGDEADEVYDANNE